MAILVTILLAASDRLWAADSVSAHFEERIQPILENYCYGCHGYGAKKGGLDLEALESDEVRLRDPKLWWSVLKNVRAELMPPAGKPRPSEQEQRFLADWIKFEAFGIDPKQPDPGHVTVRRLNRIEYRNTIRDLMGVDFDTGAEFPPDDTGHGFDNIGDVLTISPLLLEKYLAAARTIIAQAVPTVSGVAPEKTIEGRRFRPSESESRGRTRNDRSLSLSYYEPASVSHKVRVEHDGRYALILDLSATERYVDGMNDYNKCRLLFKADGQELLREEFSRQEGRAFHHEFDLDWKAGDHELAIEVEPLTPNEKQVRSLAIRLQSVTIRGPMDERFWVRPANYERFFPKPVPESVEARRDYARELLGRFANRAFRRPVDNATVDRLVALAERVSSQQGQTFEAGIAQAMTAVLASPRFLFREEGVEPSRSERYPLVDEYALASRLSYFLWSTMPDDELFRLAETHTLRENLSAQARRMLADPKSEQFMRHFVGQWLQARDVESVIINSFAVISRDEPPDPEAETRRARFRELARKPPESLTDEEKKELSAARAAFFRGFDRFRQFELTGELRRSMRRETEMLFEYIVRQDRSLVELLDCDYTFLNEPLAKYYGIEGVKGNEMRKVDLPPDSPRGGILTQGTLLTVTSNPDRTSPVKRGLFILDNILGTPPPPPPPDIPPLEEAGKKLNGRTPTLRETLALHRSEPLCNSCHNRMDPLGLAFEHFNALGRWRDQERGQEIDATGKLITGEEFRSVRELKQILANERRRDFYRCLSEKLLTYALGRGLDHRDVHVVDELVDRIETAEGHASALLMGVIESAPFQRRQRTTVETSRN